MNSASISQILIQGVRRVGLKSEEITLAEPVGSTGRTDQSEKSLEAVKAEDCRVFTEAHFAYENPQCSM